MKKVLTILVFTVAALSAQASASTGAASVKHAKKVTAKPAATAPHLTIPKDAVANPDGTYSWKDKQGKEWLFVRTPFGISRTERVSVTPATTATNVKAFDEGDKVRFETVTPFGVSKQVKNKADLTDEERNLLNNQNAKQE